MQIKWQVPSIVKQDFLDGILFNDLDLEINWMCQAIKDIISNLKHNFYHYLYDVYFVHTLTDSAPIQ